MPKPRDEDDDLFHDVDDLELDDEASDEVAKEKPKKKTAKRKTAKKKVVSEAAPKKKPKKRKKKAPAKEAAPFAASLFDEESEEKPGNGEVTPQEADDASDESAMAASSAEADAKPAEPEPETNSVVHIYELGRWKRTLERAFTTEDAEAFATEYSRTSKVYGRSAVAGEKGVEPATEA